MRIRRGLAAAALAAAVVAPAAAGATAASAQPARTCTEKVSNSVRLSPDPGYYKVTITTACGATGVTPEVKCWNSSSFIEVFGAKIRSRGVSSKASCTNAHPRLTKAWVIIGKRAPQKVWP
jgi:hypothetical protein